MRPRLSRGWLAMRATRLPFLSATIVPVLVGIAIAAFVMALFFTPAVTALLGRRAWWPGHGGDSDEDTESRWARHSYAESYYTPPTEHSR